MKKQIAQLHNRPLSPLLWPFLPLAWAYGLGARLHNMAYACGLAKSVRSQNVPVISIGNLTTGGTGKTPVTLSIAQGLLNLGHRVLILTRGYRARTPQSYARATNPDFGDEAYLLQQRLPDAIVITGRNRAENLQKAIAEYQPDFVLLDDGFQHRPINSHLNILLIEGDRLMGNNQLLPLGPLREPIAHINRADLILVTKTLTSSTIETVEAWVEKHCQKPVPVVPVAFNSDGLKSVITNKLVPSHALRQCQAVAVSGIANPSRFERDLQSFLTFKLFKHFMFDDHHNYTRTDVEGLLVFLDECPKDTVLITTEKDWVKLKPYIPENRHQGVYMLQVSPLLDFDWFYGQYLKPLLQKPVAVPSQ